eukprot:g7562.t1
MVSLFRIPPTMDDSTRTRCDAMIRLVENACSEMLLAPDWTLNMQIVDELNRERDPVVLTEVIRILRKKLGSGNPMVLSVGLTLAETLVKNCHDPVHREIASERFMAAVAKIARTYSFKTNRESLAIADQSLDIIQAWGEAFLPRRREFPLFVETYHELRAEGLPFSEQYQSDRAPVLDPGAGSLLDRAGGGDGAGPAAEAAAASLPVVTPVSRSGGGSGGGGGGGGVGAGSSGGSNELRDLSVSDREIVATGASCSEMLEQVLQAAESRAEVRDSDITAEIVEQLKQAGPKISGIIEANGEGDAGMLEAVFKVNDAVDSVLRLYKDVVDGKKSLPLLPPSSYSSDVGAVSSRMEGMSLGQAAAANSKFPSRTGQPQQQQGLGGAGGSSLAPPPAMPSAYPSAADKAQNLMANLGALYAVGTPSAMPAPNPTDAVGPPAASQATGPGAQGLGGAGGMGGPSPGPAAWGGSGAVGGGAAAAAAGGGGVAAFGGAPGGAGFGGNGNVAQAFAAMDPFAGQQQQQPGPMLPQPTQPQDQQQGYPYAQQQHQQQHQPQGFPQQLQQQPPPQMQQPPQQAQQPFP